MKHHGPQFAILFLAFGLFLPCARAQVTEPVTYSNALQRYLHNGDHTYSWKVKNSYRLDNATMYDLLLTSQQWHGTTWTHQLTVAVPENIRHHDALLFVSYGGNKDGQPIWMDKTKSLTKAMGKMASENNAITAILWQVPNQPLFNGLDEGQIISYSFKKFKESKDFSWPVIFPMVKSALRAMDAVQAFSKMTLHHKVKDFLVAGISKRGWTAWLTAASDPRVMALAPFSIDLLNKPQEDELSRMVDPYSYREKLTMPKMNFDGTNDKYFPVDAMKRYIDSIPGINLVHYKANGPHGLGDKKEAFKALSAFFYLSLHHKAYPKCKWHISVDSKQATLTVDATAGLLLGATLWSAVSGDRDFRKARWGGQDLGAKHQATVAAEVSLPTTGFRAFYVDLKYAAPNGGEYSVSTRAYVTNGQKVFIK